MSSSTILPTITPSAVLSNSTMTLSSQQIGIILGSVTVVLLLLVFLIVMIVLRRSRRQKYKQPGDESGCAGALESQTMNMSNQSRDSTFKRAEADPLIVSDTESRHSKDDLPSLPTSPVKNHYAGLAAHETHIVSLDIAPKLDVEIETATLRSSSSKSTIILTPLIIPDKISIVPNKSNGGDHLSKKSTSRKSSKHNNNPDSGWDSDDSSSLYSMASAPASVYFSRSSLETVKAPPVPPIPVHFLPTQSTTSPPHSKDADVTIVTAPSQDEEEEDSIPKFLPPLHFQVLPTQSTTSLPYMKDTDVIVTAPSQEDTIPNSLPPLPSIKFISSEDNGNVAAAAAEEEEDESQTYNVAKLLQSRQAKLPKDAIFRHSSNVSHIERSGSINTVLTPTEEGEENSESYRPRYNRLKQKKEDNNNKDSSSFPSSKLSTSSPNSLSPLSIPNPWPQDSSQLRS